MKRAVLQSCLVVLCGLVGAQAASADIITGASIAANISGTSASLNGPDGSLLAQASDPGTALSTTGRRDGTWGGSGGYTGLSEVAPYRFGGYAITGMDTTLAAFASFWDEIYFRTASGSPGYLEFDFDVSYLLDARSGTENRAALSFSLLGWDSEKDFVNLDQYLDSVVGGQPRRTVDGVITLSTAHSGNLLASGGYFPFRFDLVAGSRYGAADWDTTPVLEWDFAEGRQAVLREVRVFGLVGVPGANESFQRLAAGDYTLFSANGNSLTAVPEPASLLLLGTGLVGLCARRKRRT